MFVWLLFVIAAAALGTVALSAARVMKERVALASTGTTAGLTVMVTATYIINLLVPLSQIVIVAATLIAAGLTVALILKTQALSHWQVAKLDTTALRVLASTLLLSFLLVPNMLFTRPDGIYTGILNTYGDVAWHMANITAFAEGQSLPPENPIFSGTRLTYPFLSNFFSAMLLTAGGSFIHTVVLPGLLLIPLTFTLFYCLARDYARSRRAAVFALLLFVFGGAAFGWTQFGQLYRESELPLGEFITHLPVADFSGNTQEDSFNFMSPVLALLIPQRSFLFGMPIAFTILLLLRPTKRVNELRYIIAGVLAGLLPLFHGHTILVLAPAIISLFVLSIGSHWLLFALPALIIGIPELLYYVRGQHTDDSFFRFDPGWLIKEANPVWYWAKNTGLLIPVALAGLLFKKAPRPLKALAIAAAGIFLVGNLFLFAPWAWDNFKLLIFWLIFSAPLIGWTLHYAISHKKIPYASALVAAFLILHTVSAAVDFWKISLPTAPTWREWDTDGIAIAEQIRQHTKPGESILTAPYHNSPVVLAGRPRYLGYPGHVWSHGGSPTVREQATKQFLSGTTEVLPEDRPDYVLVGPVERQQFPDLVIRPSWRLIASEGEYQLYALDI